MLVQEESITRLELLDIRKKETNFFTIGNSINDLFD